MNPGAVAATVDALLEVVALKALARTGWVRVGVPGPESVAAHSWGVAWLVLALLPDTMDRERALVYAVIHDLPEVWTGDLTPHDAVPDKAAREHAAITAFSDRLPDRGDAVRGW
ncbi:MAG: HD domain-containing protein, partial [Myxococcota bacterium]